VDARESSELAAKVEELRTVCARLSAENEELHGLVSRLIAPVIPVFPVTAPTEGTAATEGTALIPAVQQERRVSRRMIGKALGAAAAGVVGAAVLADATASPAAAASDILSDWTNAKTAGCVGNGVTDDTANMQAAINAAIAAGNTCLYVPEGTYLCGPLSISAPLTIVGAGQAATTFMLKAASNDYQFKFAPAVNAAMTRARFTDFTLDGNGANQTTAGGGILGTGAVNCFFERLHFTHEYNWGLELSGNGTLFGHHNRVLQCTFDNAVAAGYGGGLYLTSSDENVIDECDFQYLGGTAFPSASFNYPIFLWDTAGLQLVRNCVFVGARGSNLDVVGLAIDNANQTRVLGGIFDGVGGDCVYIKGTDNAVSDCMFTSIGDQAHTAGWMAGVHTNFGAVRNIISDNNMNSSATANKTGYFIYEEQVGNSGPNLFQGNQFWKRGTLNHQAVYSKGNGSEVRNNLGTLPTGTITTPAVPASGTALVNPTNVDCMVYIAAAAGQTVTISINGGTGFPLGLGTFFLPAGSSVKLTYGSPAPAWTWDPAK
jgi:hypothetical protein